MNRRIGDYSAATAAAPHQRTAALGVTAALSPLGGNNIDCSDSRAIQVSLAAPRETGGGGADTLATVLQTSPRPAWHAYQNLYDGTDDGNEDLRDGAASNLQFAIPFTQGATGCTIYQVKLRLSRVGTPAKAGGGTPPAVWVSLQADAAGDPSGTDIGGTSAGVETADIGTTMAEYTFTFQAGVDLTAAGDYWIVIDGDYDTSATDYIAVHYNTAVSLCKYYDAAWALMVNQNIWVRMTYLYYTTVTDADVEGGAIPTFTEDEVANLLDWWLRREYKLGCGTGTFARLKFTASGGTWYPNAVITVGDPKERPLTPVNT